MVNRYLLNSHKCGSIYYLSKNICSTTYHIDMVDPSNESFYKALSTEQHGWPLLSSHFCWHQHIFCWHQHIYKLWHLLNHLSYILMEPGGIRKYIQGFFVSQWTLCTLLIIPAKFQPNLKTLNFWWLFNFLIFSDFSRPRPTKTLYLNF